LPRAAHLVDPDGMTLDADLRTELLRRVELDQAARREMTVEAEQAVDAATAWEAIAAVDGENLP
jgi:hypothetical protein